MREMTNRIINRIPNFYTREDRSVLVSIIESIVPEIEHLYDSAEQVAAMVSIDKVYPQDIWKRFGALFNLYQYSYEDDETYRARVKAVVSIKYGGIKAIIKNTVAGYVGITDTNDIDRGIKIVGAWEYDGPLPEMIRRPGYFLCIIDEDIATRKDIDLVKLNKIVNGVKAAGVRAYTTISFDVVKERATISINERAFDRITESNGESKVIINIGRYVSGIDPVLNDSNSLLNNTMVLNGVITRNIQSTCEKWWDRFIPREVRESGNLDITSGFRSKFMNNCKSDIAEILHNSISYDLTSVNEDDSVAQSITDEDGTTKITQNKTDTISFMISDSDSTNGSETNNLFSTLNSSFVLNSEIFLGSYDIIRKAGS